MADSISVVFISQGCSDKALNVFVAWSTPYVFHGLVSAVFLRIRGLAPTHQLGRSPARRVSVHQLIIAAVYYGQPGRIGFRHPWVLNPSLSMGILQDFGKWWVLCGKPIAKIGIWTIGFLLRMYSRLLGIWSQLTHFERSRPPLGITTVHEDINVQSYIKYTEQTDRT